ncbi:lipase family protein [uncultured Limnohabitans sp.]|jgi:pimeloyl-ACP methyl ester carboxylesterase|uniref:lipase family protein n=1 Tax=uncultured Limnohabitans sp. TaxID=768543 RepID=UPI0026355FBC|nr:lipase family protein [uncultured Limnohabitans sp.]
MKTMKYGISILGVALLAACGGSDAPHGSLIESPALITTLSKAQLDAGPLVALSGKAKCDVKVISLNYVTPGAKGEISNASGVLLLPTGADCTAAAPLVAYAKGTDVEKPRTLANPADSETGLLAAMYAGQGYAVVATDYLGFAKSNYSYHPYLHADSEATTVIDSIRAARNAVVGMGGSLNGKVMLTGYSQGGHASMAAHRAIEKSLSSEINVVAGAHLAGPYNLSGSMQLPDAIAGYQFFVPYLITAWQKIYGNLYSNVSDAFKSPYANGIESLLPSATLNYTTLVTSGKLPGINGETPNQARDALFQTSFSSDILTNPSNPTFLAAKKNDLLDWSPKSQTMLCSGSGDPTVPQVVHQSVMKAAFDAKGLTNVTSVDIHPLIVQTYGPITMANIANYHGSYAPPFCHAAAKSLFDAVK